jgi:hypothetical protein
LAKGWTVVIQLTCMVTPTTTRSSLLSHVVITPDVQYSTAPSIGPTPTTSAFGRLKLTSEREAGCATSTVRSPPGLPAQQLSGTLPGRPWW